MKCLTLSPTVPCVQGGEPIWLGGAQVKGLKPHIMHISIYASPRKELNNIKLQI